MNKTSYFFRTAITSIIVFGMFSCRSTSVGGQDPSFGITPSVDSYTEMDLLPGESRITYEIDCTTYANKLKYGKLDVSEAQRVALTEAADYHGCDRLIDPRVTVSKKGRRILYITVTGRPGFTKRKVTHNQTTNQSIQQGQAPVQGNMIYHVVKEGETLKQIAKAYNVSISDIVKGNNLSTSNLVPGRRLKIYFK